MLCLGFGLLGAFRPQDLGASLFLDLKPVPLSCMVSAFSAAASDDRIGFLVKDVNSRLYFITGANKGLSFSKTISLSSRKVIDQTLFMDKQVTLAVWMEEADNKIKMARISNDKVESVKPLVPFSDLGAFHPRIVAVKDGFLLLFSENYRNHSGIRLVRFTLDGTILEDKVLFQTGNNYLPQVRSSKDQICLVWNNLTGDKEELYSLISTDQGKNWGVVIPVTSNDFPDRGPVLYAIKNKFYLLWQDNRLGNWNVAYAEYNKKKWTGFSQLTSHLFNCWLPQMAFYKDKLFFFWLDKSEGNSQISYVRKGFYTSVWSDPVRFHPEAGNIDDYQVAGSDDFFTLACVKENKLYFSRVYNDFEKISPEKQEISPDGWRLSWKRGKSDLAKYSVYFSLAGHDGFFMPVFQKGDEHFAVYSKNKERLNPVLFNIRYYNDIDLLSDVSSLPLNKETGRISVRKPVDWKKAEKNTIFYQIMQDSLYIKYKYRKGIDKDRILGMLYFQIINYLNRNYGYNKFIRVFNLLNGNIDFNRLIEGDEIFLPVVWGDFFFLSLVGKDVASSLAGLEEKYNLKNRGYLYYLVSSDLGKIKEYEEAVPGDIIVLFCPY
ncbi:MAG: hypothetical protein PHF84_06800 [bacterium]|nr:hypothetical protein [bacterium]